MTSTAGNYQIPSPHSMLELEKELHGGKGDWRTTAEAIQRRVWNDLREEIAPENTIDQAAADRCRERLQRLVKKQEQVVEEAQKAAEWEKENTKSGQVYIRQAKLERYRLKHLQYRIRIVEAMERIRHPIEALDGSGPNAFNPKSEADEIFDGMKRKKGGPNIPRKVAQWAARSHQHYEQEKGMGSEEAKEKVLTLASERNYEFGKRWLAEQVTALRTERL